MFLAKVEGQVVSTKKDPNLKGAKLMILRTLIVDEKDPSKLRTGSNTLVAVDSMGCGVGEVVMYCQGSSARQTHGLKNLPVDCAIVAIVDSVDVLGNNLYKTKKD